MAKRGRPLTPEEHALRVDCWNKRMSLGMAAQICGCSTSALCTYYHKHGLHRTDEFGIVRKNGITPEIGQEIIALRERGESIRTISEISGFSRRAVRDYLWIHTGVKHMDGNGLPMKQEALRMECWNKRMKFSEAARVCGTTVTALQDWCYRRGLRNTADAGFVRKNGAKGR